MPNCPICNVATNQSIYKSSNTPLCRYGFVSSADEPAEVTDIDILFCDSCQFGWNALFTREKINYASNKIIEANRFSARYRAHFENSSIRIKNFLNSNIQTMVEIGAGACDFLGYFKEVPNRYAVEPSDELLLNTDQSIKSIKQYYSSAEHSIPADLVVFRQVLEHIDAPKVFLDDLIKGLVKSNGTTYFYIEVPNSEKTFAEGRFFDIYYDHCNYFTVKSITSILEACGLKVCELTLEMNKEIICVLASTEKFDASISKQTLNGAVGKINSSLTKFIEQNKRIFVWGAAGNGANLLNTLQLDAKKIPFVIDKDPNKQGKFIPIMGQEIISPTAAVAMKPDVILIMSQFHQVEIAKECLEIFGKDIILL
mgnify:CR=1 FL=1